MHTHFVSEVRRTPWVPAAALVALLLAAPALRAALYTYHFTGEATIVDDPNGFFVNAAAVGAPVTGIFTCTDTPDQPPFSVNANFTNHTHGETPTNRNLGNFGQSVAALGSDRVLVGEWGNTVGIAYIFRAAGGLLKKFPSLGEGFGWSVAAVGDGDFVLQQSDLLGSRTLWLDVTDPITVTGQNHTLRLPVGTAPQVRFYRLIRP